MISRAEAEELLQKDYYTDNFFYLVSEVLFSDFKADKHEVIFNNSLFTKINQVGTSKTCDVTIYEVGLAKGTEKRRVAITQEMFRVLRGQGINNALVAFYNADRRNYRISLLTSKYEFDGDKIVRILSNPRRFSYTLGYNTKTHTAYKYLIAGGHVKDLEDLISRFSVEVVNKQFYSEIASCFSELVGGERDGKKYHRQLELHGVINQNKYSEFAVRLIGRIVFCWFLKEKKSDNGCPLISSKFVALSEIVPNYYHLVLEPLFFELLNTKQSRRKGKYAEEEIYKQIPYLNGGLFSPHTDDHYKYDSINQCGTFGLVTIPDDWFIRLYTVLEQYNFTVDENTSYDIELSIDPEMLGRIFENLLAEINPETGENAKKSTGSFYTPRDIVDYMVDSSLLEYLKEKTGIDEIKIRALISYSKEDDHLAVFTNQEKKAIINALYTVSVLDPACGSGAFPIGMLQKIVYILQEIDPAAHLWFDKATENVSILIKREFEKKFNAGSLDYIRKLSVIQNSIFGVDIQPIAVEIARLRCFLSLIIEETVNDNEPNRGVNPLPNLDFKFVIANSLIELEGSVGAYQTSLFEDQDHIKKLQEVRDLYFRVEDADEKKDLKDEFREIQQAMLVTTINNYDKQASRLYQSLSAWKPFSNEPTSWFDPEWMFGIKGGFDIVIGNPPYIQLQKSADGARTSKVGDMYAKCGYETFTKMGDIYCLFYEKGIKLLKDNGILTYITSNKWMRAAYGKNLRRFLARQNPINLIDFAGQKVFESATVDVNILVCKKSKNMGATLACTANSLCKNNLSVFVQQYSVSTNYQTQESWVILSAIENSISCKIKTVGVPLKKWNIKVYRGVLTGLNDAFIIDTNKKDQLIEEDPRSAEIIRPILRGRDIKRYGYSFANLWVICARYGSYEYIPTEYPAIYKHLKLFKEELEERGQCRYTSSGKTNTTKPYPGQHHWLELDNNPSKEYLDDFSKQKIVWSRLTRISKADFSSFPRFALDDSGYYVLDSLCFFTGDNLQNLIHLLNSEFAAYYFFNSVAILDNGGLQMRQQYVEEIPLPQIAKNLSGLSQEEIDNTIYEAFHFTQGEIEYIKEFLRKKKDLIQSR